MRTLCLDLPEARETLTFNHPNFQVGKKAFAVLEDYGGGLGITFRATPLQQQALLQSGPRFSIPPYVGHHGWTALRLDESIDWDEISALLEEAYRLAAPKRLLKQLDAPR